MKAPEFHLGGLSPLELETLTLPELRAVLPEVQLAVVTLGSIEQHGPNTALETDLAMAHEMARMASARLYPKLLVVPPIPWGMSDYHMDFPGTLSLRPETVLDVLRDIFGSLRQHGIENWLITNFHSGNEGIINVAVQALGTEMKPNFLGSVSLAQLEPDNIEAQVRRSPVVGHGCEVETAELMYIRPDLVRMEDVVAGGLRTEHIDRRRKFFGSGVRVTWSFADGTSNGALGDSRHASYEGGKNLVEGMMGEFMDILDEIMSNWLDRNEGADS
ncbi:MAG TPA: creatininase family protein [Chloroflexota bacterium]|nr:creatininase family protein [Chloroflexota bacterium]